MAVNHTPILTYVGDKSLKKIIIIILFDIQTFLILFFYLFFILFFIFFYLFVFLLFEI